jgi:hypothetical protein
MFLRLGCAVVAWLVLFAHCLWLAVLGSSVDCANGGAQPWLALLLWTPLTLLFVGLLPLGFGVPGIGRLLRAPAVLLIPLLALAGRATLSTMVTVNFGGEPICAGAAGWQPFWAPVQIATLSLIAIVGVWVWRRGAVES